MIRAAFVSLVMFVLSALAAGMFVSAQLGRMPPKWAQVTLVVALLVMLLVLPLL